MPVVQIDSVRLPEDLHLSRVAYRAIFVFGGAYLRLLKKDCVGADMPGWNSNLLDIDTFRGQAAEDVGLVELELALSSAHLLGDRTDQVLLEASTVAAIDAERVGAADTLQPAIAEFAGVITDVAASKRFLDVCTGRLSDTVLLARVGEARGAPRVRLIVRCDHGLRGRHRCLRAQP